jgi:hypothetical protein
MPHFKFDDIKVCHKCDHLDTQPKPKLTWPADLWADWLTVTQVNRELEVLALFNVDADNRVTHLEVPEQEIESGACRLLTQNGHHDGMIHSHHNMSAFMSGDDKATLMPNYRFSMVTNHKGEVLTFERITLPCDGIGFKEVETFIEMRPEDTTLVTLVKERTKRKEWPVMVTPTDTPTIGGYTGNYGVVTGFTAKTKDNGRKKREKHNLFRDDDQATTEMAEPYDYLPIDERVDVTGLGSWPDSKWGCDDCHIYWLSYAATPHQCWFCRSTTVEVDIEDGETWYEADKLGRAMREDIFTP